MENTNTNTNTEQTTTIRTTRKGLTDHNSATFTARATQAVAFESKEHMRIAYGELVNVWAIPHGTPVDVEGQEAATFIPESVAKVLPLRFLVKARPSINADVQEMERILFNPATSTTAAAKAFVAFVERNNGNESAPYAEQAGRFLYKSSVKPVLKNGQGAIRSCLNSVLPYFLFMAFTGVNVVKEWQSIQVVNPLPARYAGRLEAIPSLLPLTPAYQAGQPTTKPLNVARMAMLSK